MDPMPHTRRVGLYKARAPIPPRHTARDLLGLLVVGLFLVWAVVLADSLGGLLR